MTATQLDALWETEMQDATTTLLTTTRWSNLGPPNGFGGEYAYIAGLKHGRILIQASQDEANLIAAAPELLAALKACQLELHYCSLQLCSSGWTQGSTVTAALKAGIDAITKAEGGAA
jgi:hypothetical protein